MKIYSFLICGAVIAACLAPCVASAAWEIEPTHTHVSFEVEHMGMSHTPGIFRKVDSSVKFDEKKVELSSVLVSIDTASVDTAVAQRDAALRSADWFDAERNPQITFASKSVRRIDENHYVISGDLTVRGVTRPVDFNTVLTARTTNPFLKVPAVGFVATARIKRSDFGMTQILFAVSDEVDLKIALEMNQKP